MQQVGRIVAGVHESVIRSLPIHERGLVRIQDNKLINSLTGVAYESIQEAIQETSVYGSMNALMIRGTKGLLSQDNEEFGVLSQILRNINQYMGVPEAQEYIRNTPILNELKDKNLMMFRLGFSEKGDETLRIISGLELPPGSGTYASEALAEGRVLPPGILNTTKDGVSLLRFGHEISPGEYKFLTGEESLSLMSAVGADFFDNNKLIKALNSGKVGAFMQKASKRLIAHTADRNFVMDGEDIDSLVKQLGKNYNRGFTAKGKGAALATPKEFKDTFLFFNPELETTLKAFGLTEEYETSLMQGITDQASKASFMRERAATNIVMEGTDTFSAGQYFADALVGMGLDDPDDYLMMQREVTNIIKSNIKNNEPVTIGGIVDALNNLATGGDPMEKIQYRSFGAILGEMEKIDDGSGFMLGTPLRHKAELLKKEIIKGNKILESTTDPATIDILKGNINKKTSALDKIVNNSNEFINGTKVAPSLRGFQDNTARILIGRGQGKTVLDLIDERGLPVGSRAYRLSRLGYWGAGSHALNKEEIGFGQMLAPGSKALGLNSSQALTMNLVTGEAPDRVYADMQAMIFHKDEYKNGFNNQIKNNVDKFEEDITALMERGEISQSVRSSIRRDAAIDPNNWEHMNLSSRNVAVNMQQNAAELQNAIMSGKVKPNEIPELANQLIKYMQKNVFRQGGTYRTSAGEMPIYQAYLPYSQRSAIETEGRNSRSLFNIILGSRDTNSVQNIKTNQGELNLFKYRFDGHKMIIPNSAAADVFGLYQAGGGFDLDDKFITNLHYIRDTEGNRRLATFAWRQPTGPQEYALMTPHLDEATIKRLFGSDTEMGEKFRKLSNGVDELMKTEAAAGLSDREIKTFGYINKLINGENKAANSLKPAGLQQEEIEKALFRIFDIGGKEKFQLGDSAAEIDTLSFARQFLDVRQEKFQNVKGVFLNDISEVNPILLERAAAYRTRGTPLALSPDEIFRYASEDKNFAVQYRRNQLTQITDANIVLNKDEILMNDISNLWSKHEGSSFDVFKQSIDRDMLNAKQTRQLSDMDYVYGAAGRMMRDGSPEAVKEAKLAIDRSFQRMQVESLTANDGLGKYVNRLGWLASSGDQRIAAIEELARHANEIDSPELLKITQDLASRTYLVWNPEHAIDTSIGLGKAGIGVTYQDLLSSHLNSIEGNPLISLQSAKQSLNNALYSMYGREDDELWKFSKTLLQHVATDPTNGRFKNIVGKTEKQIFDMLKANPENHKEVFEYLINNASDEVMSLINASADNIGARNIEAVAKHIGEVRAIQLMFPGSYKESGLAGIDQLATRLKLSDIAIEASDVSDVDLAIQGTLEGLGAMQDRLKSAGLGSDSGFNEIRKLEDTLYLAGIRHLRKDGKEEYGAVLKRKETFLKLFGFNEKTAENYGSVDTTAQVLRAESLQQKAAAKLKMQKFNPYEASALSRKRKTD